MRERLRTLKSLAGPFPLFDPSLAPEDPIELFSVWLELAIDTGIREPHAMTLSTVDERGLPDARVVILKNLDERGWHFAGSDSSPKGRQLAVMPKAALTFYWPQLGRQVRVRGQAIPLGATERQEDFLARPPSARAIALLARQSEVLHEEWDLDRELIRQQERLRAEPDATAPHWCVYAVAPASVEFWQGDAERRHTRLRYRRDARDWARERLWP